MPSIPVVSAFPVLMGVVARVAGDDLHPYKGEADPMDRDSRQHQRRGFRGTAENAKTRICQRWENGECRFGDRCNFAHGDEELRRLPPRGDGPNGWNQPGRGRGGHYRDDHGYGGRGRGGEGYYGDHHGHHGMHHAHSQEHQAWVASGCPVAGLNGWTQYTTPSGEKYYHNSNTDETQWDAPKDWREPGQAQG